MAEIHYLKRTPEEAVLKCYKNSSNGGEIDINLANLAVDGETFDRDTADVGIQEIYWGAKVGKQIDITRLDDFTDPENEAIHGHYYLVNQGFYDYNGFLDNAYSNWNIRIIGDGPFHVTIKLKKTYGYS